MDDVSIAAITRVLARARDGGADDEVTARHILTALKGIGWRRIDGQVPPHGVTPAPPNEEFRAARAAIQRHADHGPEVTCRPAGNGLCEPHDGRQLQPWRDAITP